MTLNAEHEHYKDYSTEMAKRLEGFWGEVDDRLNTKIARHVIGSKVLDVGCGFGTLVEKLRARGMKATGIDMLGFCIEEARRRFPLAEFRLVEDQELPFLPGEFDSVTLKDTVHHIFGESDVDTFCNELKRVCLKRVVILDPNPTLLLRIARWLIGHKDPVCAPMDAQRLLEKAGFEVKCVLYSEVLAFPLSGGYVGRPLMPNILWLQRLVLNLDDWLAKFMGGIGLLRFFAWRYLIVADRVMGTNGHHV